jgi:FimV-like protein
MGRKLRNLRAPHVALAIALFLLVSSASAGEHVVQPGETLWGIARAQKSDYPDASLPQVVWGLIRANPGAFPEGPGKLKRGTRLLLPSAETVADTAADDAVQNVKTFYSDLGQTPPVALTPPGPAAPPPVIAGVELLPAMGAETRQWFAVSGSGFAPRATLEFFDVARNRGFSGRAPASTTPNRLEYQARFGETASRWRVTVRNPNGQKSAAFEFEAGRNVTVVLAPEALQKPAEITAAPAAIAAAPAAPDAFRESAEAKSLPAEPKPRYQQLASLEDRYSGDVDYDYTLGSAAVDAGNYSEAVFPLQRAVAMQPDFAGARLELARAYYGVGDNESARREFTSLRNEKPPPRVEEMIRQYLDAIDLRAIEYQQQATAFAELAAGHDSNANGATDSQVFLGFNLTDRSRATSSPYYGLNIGGLYSYPLTPGWRTQVDAQVSGRQVPDASYVNSEQARAGAALEWRNGIVTVNGAGSYAYAQLDGEENNTNIALDLNVSGAFAQNWQWLFGARRSALRFVDALALQDVDSTLLSLSLSTPVWNTLLSAGLTGGQDKAVETGSPFGRSLSGARLSSFTPVGNTLYLLTSVAGLQSDYDGQFFGLDRKDTQYSATVALDWQGFPARLWSIKTQLNYVTNDSGIELFTYDRFDIGLVLRRDFR